MGGDFLLRVHKQKICETQATAQVWKLLVSAVELVMQIVWNEAFYETLKESIDARRVKF